MAMTFEIRQHVTASPIGAHAEQFMIPMRDGVLLATDVYLPETPQRHGAVLVRGPYDKNSRYQGLGQMAEIFNGYGLVLVTQDVRGKFRSQGETVPYAYDVADGYVTIEWIVTQRWSNGAVGLHGNSYLGYLVWASVASGHPAIKGAVAQGTAVDMGIAHVGSLWRQQAPRATNADDLVQIWVDNDIRYVTIDYSMLPRVDALEEAVAAIGTRSAGLDALLRRSQTGEIPHPYGNRHPWWTTNVPVLHWSNWFDVGLGPPGLRDFRYFRTLPGRRDLHYLRAESADHGGVRLADVPYEPELHPSVNDDEHRRVEQRQAIDGAEFLLPLLTGRGTLPDAGRRVRWELGHVGWQSTSDWPPDGAVPKRWCLGDAHAASDPPDGGSLSVAADTARATVTWDHDPMNPVPSAVTPDDFWNFLLCWPDERALGERPDVITFTSEPLKHHLDVVGQGHVHFGAQTTGPSMHIFAKLVDVHPDGMARPIAHGRLVLFEPDLDERYQLDLDTQAYRVHPGHRLRLHLSSSDNPLHLIHPGTDDNPWFAARYQVNRQSVSVGGAEPAYLDLPVLEGR